MKDYTEDEVALIGLELQALIKPFIEKHKIKYVLSGSVQKSSDPTVGTHFVLTSDAADPMWAMQSIARSGLALKPLADAQLAHMTTPKN